MTRFQPFEEEEWEEEEGGKAVPDANVEAHFCLGIVAIIVGISLLAYIGANLVDASPLHSTPLELAGVEVLIGVMAVALLSCIACAACTPKVADSMPLWVMTVGTVLSIGIVAFIAALLALDSKTLAADVGVGALVVSFCSCYCYARVLIAYDPGRKRNKMWPRAKRDKWGSIAKQVAGHPENVEPADTWLSVVLMWGTLPLCLPIAIAAALSPRFFRSLSLATKNSARRGRPLVDAPLWWVYALATLISLAVSGSRLAFQLEARKRFGDGVWFWQSEGAWACTYQRVDEIARSQQKRDAGFAATTAVVPEMFPRGIVLFLSNYIAKTRGELSEWQDLRSMLHEHFLDTGMAAYTRRVSLLDERIAADWEAPSLKQLQDDAHTARLVAKCVFFVVFGIWVTDAEAKTLASWKKAAALFVLPRMVHRFLLNIGAAAAPHRAPPSRGPRARAALSLARAVPTRPLRSAPLRARTRARAGGVQVSCGSSTCARRRSRSCASTSSRASSSPRTTRSTRGTSGKRSCSWRTR